MVLKRRTFLTLATAAPLAAAATFAATRPAAANQSAVYTNNGIAVDGTDVVSYFTDGAPVSGDAGITHDWNGATWRFSSEANRAAFAADPDAYAPQYGGYCAYAVAQGSTASTVPDAWAIVDDKLYLNFNRRIQRRWEEDPAGYIAAADANWPGILA